VRAGGGKHKAIIIIIIIFTMIITTDTYAYDQPTNQLTSRREHNHVARMTRASVARATRAGKGSD
jgi:uncharacterized protein YpmB